MSKFCPCCGECLATNATRCADCGLELSKADDNADLAAAQERIEALTDELAIKTNAYSVWHQRALDAEAERDKYREALRLVLSTHHNAFKINERTTEDIEAYEAAIIQAAAILAQGGSDDAD